MVRLASTSQVYAFRPEDVRSRGYIGNIDRASDTDKYAQDRARQ